MSAPRQSHTRPPTRFVAFWKNQTPALAGGVAALLAATALAAAAAEYPAKPNIIIILADDLGPGDMSCAGATKFQTPNIDLLAAEGVRFTQGYAPSATCTPSRYSLLTGEYAWRQKAKSNTILDGDAPLCIEPGRPTLPAMVREAGYEIGRAHV